MFFVLKQKTAYEMRISDWSSDVCSSDLQITVPVQERTMGDMPCAGMDVKKPVHCASQLSGRQLAREHLVVAPLLAPTIISFVIQIGRASCRERVGQYV